MGLRATWVNALLFGGLLLQASAASAQRRDRLDVPYFAAKLMLGVGGEAEFEAVEGDLELSWGGGFAYMHPLHRYFALGGQLSFQSWQTEAGDNADLDRNVYVDLALVPQGKLPLSRDVELQLSLPLGPMLNFIGEDEVGVAGLGMGEVDTALGFAIGVMAGVRFALSDDVGLLAEFGYVVHGFEHEVTGSSPIGSVSADFEVDLSQFALNFGLTF